MPGLRAGGDIVAQIVGELFFQGEVVARVMNYDHTMENIFGYSRFVYFNEVFNNAIIIDK